MTYSRPMIRLTAFQDKTVGVFGLGGSGLAAAEALRAGGANVVVWDDNPTSVDAARAENFAVEDFHNLNWGRLDSLVVAPGVPLTHPEPHWTVKAAHAAGVEVIGDVELFIRQRALVAPDAPFVAITGTNGKSTTTALTAHILKALGCHVSLGGNIGKAILSLEPPEAGRVHVVEMSSYQIDLTPTLSPTVGVLLNVSPDHLDRHGTIEHYADVKARLVTGAAHACICVDDVYTKAVAQDIAPPDRLYAFTKGQGSSVVPRGYAIGTSLFVHTVRDGVGQSEQIANLDGSATLRGAHNIENALAAVLVVRALTDHYQQTEPDLSNRLWRPTRIADGLKTFPGLAHRLQPIARQGKVLFVNDSKATNAESAEKALASFDGDIYWIVGGRAKDGGIDALKGLFPRVAKAYLIGEAAGRFADTLQGRAPFETVKTMEAAVVTAAADAATSAAADPVVLLSPACASFDQYRNFELRGDHFAEIVAALSNVEMIDGAP